MKRVAKIITVLMLIAFLVECAPKYAWKSEPNMKQSSNEYFSASILPIFIFNGYKGFVLNIHNNTRSNLEVDWSRTFYVHGGQKNGLFSPKGLVRGEKDKPMPPDIIPGDSVFSKEIYPSNLISYSAVFKSQVYEAMKPGENGVYLTVKVDGKEVTETLTLNFSPEEGK